MADDSTSDDGAVTDGDRTASAGVGRETTPVRRLLERFEGPNTIGAGSRFWAGFGAVTLFALAYPLFTNEYQVITWSTFFIWVLLALSLTLVWGYTGIFSFGQTAFFGIGAYLFGVVGTNLLEVTGATNVAFLVAIAGPALFAGVIGYFIFYGRIGGVYVGIVTFSVTLILGLLLTRTSGTTIGSVALGGNTGLTAIPTMVLGYGPVSVSLGNVAMYYFAVVSLVGTYVGLRYLLNSDYGYVMVAVREDEERTEMFGYDVRRVKLVVFVGGAALAGFAGALYASAGTFISPGIMGLTAAALPVIWVTVGGRSTLLGSVVGAVGLQYMDQKISLLGSQFSLILLGLIVIVTILFFPEGVVPTVERKAREELSARSVGVRRTAERRPDGGEDRE